MNEPWRIWLHITGTSNVSGPWYGFWSGFAGDITLILGLGSISYTLWRRHSCHHPWCPRIQWRAHPDDAQHIVCRHHHPQNPTAL